ncbi:hypothetical protein K1T73_13860 [Roseovarius sp. SCSIO 43702]|uniref:hypothetical protein n=1 Tax=Roseovarius sp. SCSIO 43702 TaxID=2823043 RepID=UPI001C7381B5|nr:hypothetical protein [Roseovarius sp. SCSIO 43702]QYX56136.1 hypothetical protein K1T73_13860 [Roseovarius sp. SCSIO 43702]
MRRVFAGLSLLALAACGTAIPESNPERGSGVGFGNYDTYAAEKARRDAALAGDTALPPAGAISGEQSEGALASAAAASTTAQTGDVGADTLAALDATDRARAEANSGELPLEADPANPPPTVSNAAGISQENDFDAVGAERSIEEDKARVAANRAQYEVVQPKALPARTGDQAPNIVAYALQNKHPIGTQVYRRLNLASGNRYARNCAQYPSADKAQEDFLASGGPTRDRKGLDPDGDGYACGWNPAPFRTAVGG